VIGGLVGSWIPRLTNAHYLIPLTIYAGPMHGSSRTDDATGAEALREIRSKLADEPIIATVSQDRASSRSAQAVSRACHVAGFMRARLTTARAAPARGSPGVTIRPEAHRQRPQARVATWP
jgi:hypothetical protein